MSADNDDNDNDNDKADFRYVSAPASDAADQAGRPTSYPVTLYPEIEPYHHDMLGVGDGHSIYYEQCGNPEGVPVVFLHGGPGGGCDAKSRRFFDPRFYRIVVFDQRGSGRSEPNSSKDLEASLVGNNTQKLVADVESLRKTLGVSKWGLVLGGSWGSTLALAYAQAHPDRCVSLVLRGVFLFGPDEVDHVFSNGDMAGQYPEAWDTYSRYIEETSEDWERERTNLLGAYWKRLTDDDADVRKAAAAAFVGYELSITKTFVDRKLLEKYLGTPTVLIPFATLEVLYMINGGFLKRGQLLDGVGAMKKHHVSICHGRFDCATRPLAAYRLAKALEKVMDDPEEQLNLEFVAGCSHSDTEPGLVDAMVRATNRLRDGVLKDYFS